MTDDLRRQVLAAVERSRLSLRLLEPCTVYYQGYNHGLAVGLIAILAEFGMNPDGTMKESNDAD